MTTNWFDDSHPAMLEEKLENGMVKCHLSPRNCVIAPGRRGFCGVRANKDGQLVTLNYGKSVHATVETIETEAIFHYAPGDRILSMGNIGCMLTATTARTGRPPRRAWSTTRTSSATPRRTWCRWRCATTSA
jgi:hypothetical protein